MLVVPINIDFLGIGKPCNNIDYCNQCLLSDFAKVNGTFSEEMKIIEKIMLQNASSSFYFYPAEIATSPQFIPLMAKQGQKAMSNGLLLTRRPEVLDMIVENGIDQLNISLYSDWKEQAVFYNTTQEQYEQMVDAIKLSVDKGIEVITFSIVTPENIEKLLELYSLSKELGISRINLLPLVPVGKAKGMDEKYFLKQKDMPRLSKVVESIKRDNGPYVSMMLSFGLSESSASKYKDGKTNSWVKTQELCPIIGGGYAGVNINTGNVQLCYKLMNEPWAKIGFVKDDGTLTINSPYDLSKNTLVENLEGKCSKDNCDIQELCLGGCRAFAMTYALRQNSELSPGDVIYAENPICRK